MLNSDIKKICIFMCFARNVYNNKIHEFHKDNRYENCLTYFNINSVSYISFNRQLPVYINSYLHKMNVSNIYNKSEKNF